MLAWGQVYQGTKIKSNLDSQQILYKGTTAIFVFLSNYITLESFVSSREYGRRAAFVDLKLEA